jgi:hypothetical protein
LEKNIKETFMHRKAATSSAAYFPDATFSASDTAAQTSGNSFNNGAQAHHNAQGSHSDYADDLILRAKAELIKSKILKKSKTEEKV